MEHPTVSIAVDLDGYIHIAGNGASPLRYARAKET